MRVRCLDNGKVGFGNFGADTVTCIVWTFKMSLTWDFPYKLNVYNWDLGRLCASVSMILKILALLEAIEFL